MQQRFLLIFWAFDHLLLAIFTLGNCRPYEMISSALWALERDGRFFGYLLRPVVDVLLRPLGKDHCERSYNWQIHIYESAQW